jgi:hypothetical protein
LWGDWGFENINEVKIDLRARAIYGIAWDTFRKYTKLEFLDLSHNTFSFLDSGTFQQLIKLKVLKYLIFKNILFYYLLFLTRIFYF